MQSILDAAVYNQIRAYAKFNRIYLLEKERLLSGKSVVYERAKVQSTPGRSEAIYPKPFESTRINLLMCAVALRFDVRFF